MTQISTANHQEKSIMRIATSLLACSFGIFAAAQLQAQTNVVSDPVGFYKVTLTAGAGKFIQAPLHKIQSYRGIVSGTSGNIVNLNGNPSFTANAFNKATIPGGSAQFYQYILIVRNDASATPGIEGDWWFIESNTTTNITLNPSHGAVSTIGAGDQIEVRKLTSIADLFGYPTSILNPDSTGDQAKETADVIRFVNGTSFGAAVSFYTGGPTGYLYSGDSSGSGGSAITIGPDQTIIVFRKAGGGNTNITSLGQVHIKRLTHYLVAGGNSIGNPFPVNAPLGPSGLEQSGWQTDTTGNQSKDETDVIRVVNGTSFGAAISLQATNVTGFTTNTWYDGSTLSGDIPLTPGAGYIMFRKTGSLTWRQNVPFTP